MKYYTYIYIRPDNNDVFYVGKGSGSRYRQHLKRARNPHLYAVIKHLENAGLKPIIKKILITSSEDEAYDLEKFLISFYGRKDLGTGTLVNKTEGGEACAPSPEEAAKHSERMKKLKRTPTWSRAISESKKGTKTSINNTVAKPIMVNYRVYPTVKEAALGEKTSERTLSMYLKQYKRCGWPDGWKYLTKSEYYDCLNDSQNEINLPLFGESLPSKVSFREKMLGRPNSNHPKCLKVIINGITYDSLSLASKSLNVCRETIKRRIRNQKDGWAYVQETGTA